MIEPRRRILLGGLAAVLAGGEAGAAPAPGRGLIYRKLLYAADQRIGFSWLKGTRYGVVDTDPIPLWDMHIGEIFKVRDLPGGDYEVATYQTAFYTDLETGRFLTRFANPLTGQTNTVVYRPPVATRTVLGAHGPRPAEASPTRRERIGPVEIVGDQVSVRSDTAVRIAGAGPNPGRGTRINDLTTWFGSLREISDPKIPMPLSGHMFSDINTWPAWMEMGDRPGDYYSRCLGRKVARIEDMPQTWRDLMADRFPAIWRDPASAVTG